MKRKLLAFILKLLSRWAIRKHDMKILVVAGKHGTKITGELIAGMLQPDYTVRRQLEVPFWDFSIPLAILGMEDRRYTSLQWLGIVITVFLQLLFGKSNFTWTILQMNTFKKDIARYWVEILEPEVTTFVNIDDRPRALEVFLVKKTNEKVIFSADYPIVRKLVGKSKAETIVAGKHENSDLTLKFIKELDNGVALTFEDEDNNILEFFAFQKGHFMINPLVAAIATLLAMDFDYEDVQEKLARTEIDLERFLLNTS